MKTTRNILILLFILNGFLPAQIKNDVMGEVIQNINIDSLLYYVKELSGKVNFTLNNQSVSILSRHKNNADNAKAADYLFQKFTQYNMPVFKQDFSTSGRNIYAVQQGTELPNQKLIICAHYDSQPAGSLAPGADDNASGTAAVIEAARLLKEYSFPYTIVYALWDEEEQGLIGSKYYADNAAASGDSIIAVVNIDMIAWNRSNSNIVEIHTTPKANSIELGDKMFELNSVLDLGLIPVIKNPGATYSDHSSFWDNNYSAILLIEDDNDFNAYYHTPGDTIGNFNIPYFLKCTKLSIATLLTYALNLNMNLQHQPIQSVSSAGQIITYANISTGLEIGANDAAPSLYYRTNSGTGFGGFDIVKGELEKLSGNYKFIIPEINLGNIVEYYIAAQDTASAIVRSLPMGAKGFNPPGNIPPATFYRFYVAEVSNLFADSINDAGNWTLSGSAGLSNTKYVSAPYSLTDSPAGLYLANATNKMKLVNQIHITESLGTELLYQAQWAIEPDYDYAQVQISTDNGNTWTALSGRYTEQSTGSFQPSNQPVYDGTQNTWVEESIDLSSYSGKNILIQFLLKSDGYLQEDGFYFDDITVKSYNKFTDVEDNYTTITSYNLNQNYPNPFNGQTIMSFELPVQSSVSLIVYDIIGRQIATVVDNKLNAGRHTYNFNASNLSSGVYFYTLKTENFTSTRKLVLLK
ncbi:MAG: M20/M25/M40 family metallo-hydrolase [bacterium]